MSGNIINKEQCPICASEGRDNALDNLVTFDSGVQYCVAGHETIGKIQTSASPLRSQIVISKPMISSDLLEGEDPVKPIRSISVKTMKHYGYQINTEEQAHIANYFDNTGKVVMQQLRKPDKNFPLRGNKEYKEMLYGSWLFTPDERVFITITEGQLDALSIAEAFNCKYPVVSLPQGARGAERIIAANKKYLDGFKYVVLCFDQDAPGREATEKCLKLFEPGKVRIAKLATKDANEMLQQGKGADLRQAVYNAVSYIPAPILTGDQWLDTLKGFSRQTRPWPWQKANSTIAPMSIPGIYTLAALPGCGKTVVVADIMRDAIEKTGHVGVISLEESSQNLLLKLTDMLKGTNLSDITNRSFTDSEIELCREATEKVVTYNHREYGSGLETILDNLPYIAQSLNCDTIIFDNLSYSATDENDDERRSIDKAMIRLKDSTTKYNYALINVTHLNQDGDDHTDSTIRGSRGIIMYSDYVIHLGRDVEAEDFKERNTLNFYVKKDRLRGIDTGKSFDLHYDPKTRRFKEIF